MAVRNDENGRWHIVVRFVPGGPATAFLDAVEWFEGWLAPVVRRPLKAGTYWCGQWQEDAEAVERLRALWQAWEAARAEGATLCRTGGRCISTPTGPRSRIRLQGPSRRVPGGASTVPTSRRFRATSRGPRSESAGAARGVLCVSCGDNCCAGNEFPLFHKAFR